MNPSKRKSFNEKMGKAKHFPRHQNLSKGGMVDKRKHFADGGVSDNTTQSTAGSAGLSFGSNGNNSVFSPGKGFYDPQGFTNDLGGVAQGISAAFTAQNGYQAQLAPTTQFDYAPTTTGGSNVALNPNIVNSAIEGERNLSNQYGDIAAGRGPNPARTALNNTTAKNVANTAALQAGQRGSAGNVGLMSRQIGQTGAATQQTAAGQEANLEANQQLGAMGAQGALQNQIATQGLGEQGIGANVYATGAGANNAQNATNVSNYSQAQGLNQATAQANADSTNKTMGGLMGGVGSLLSFLNKGGEVEKKFDDGGPVLGVEAMPGSTPAPDSGPSLDVDTTMPNPENSTIAVGELKPEPSIIGNMIQGVTSRRDSSNKAFENDGSGGPFGSFFKGLTHSGGGGGGGKGSGGGASGLMSMFARGGNIAPGPHASHVANFCFAEGGGTAKVPALVSAKEVYLNPHQVKEVVERGADPMKIGMHIPGKDKVKYNSQKNDVIPMDLDDGGVVLPIDITTHKDASEKGRKFVVKAHEKRYIKKPKGI